MHNYDSICTIPQQFFFTQKNLGKFVMLWYVCLGFAALPPIQLKPSQETPFLFFHDPKTAGSTLRHHLARRASAHKVTFFIPCYNRVSCKVYSLTNHSRTAQKTAVLAGHFQWGVQNDLPSAKQFACFTTLRDPVQRTVSYYYERIYPSYPVRISTLQPQDLDTLLGSFVRIADEHGADLKAPVADGSVLSLLSKYLARKGTIMDEGPANTLTRMLSGNNQRKGKPASVVLQGFDFESSSKPWTLANEDFGTAKANLAKCVVGMQEEWFSTVGVLERWFPWTKKRLDKQGETNPLMVRAHKGKNKPEHEEQLSEELLEVIRRHNKWDLELYEIGTALFREQTALVASEVAAARTEL
jgi:hypothetical protein